MNQLLKLHMQYFAESADPAKPATEETAETGTSAGIPAAKEKEEETVAVPKGKFAKFMAGLFAEEDDEVKEKSEDKAKETATKADKNKSPANAFEKRLAAAKAKWEAEAEAKAKLEKLPAEEKAKAEAEEYKRKFEEANRAIEAQQLKNEAISYLRQEGYPIELADCVPLSSKEDMAASIEKVTKAFEKALEAKWKEQFAGKTPKGLGGGKKADDIQAIIANSIRGGM